MEITEIKRHLSIQTVLQHYNLTPDKSKQICCPFHADDTPSCRIYPETNSFHCFGCGATGDVIELVQRLEGCDKHSALVKAAALITNDELRMTRNGASAILSNPNEEKTLAVSEILTRAFTHFARGLKNVRPKKAITYLESRKLDYTNLSIGFDSGTLHKLPATTRLQKQEYLQAGLLKPDKFGRANNYYTRFNNCIVFPLLDRNGNIVSLYGRHIESGHHYLEGEHKGLYPGYPKADTKTLLLTECVIDAASLYVFK
jgi:DNA primase